MKRFISTENPMGGGGCTCSATYIGKRAFTLAEVLITLGIIGIIAALTLQTVIANSKKKEISSKLKKFYSSLNQAVLLSEIDNGDYRYWDFSHDGLIDEDGNKDQNLNTELSEKFFNKYIAKYLKYIRYEKGFNSTNEDTGLTILTTNRIILADGAIVYLGFGNCADFIVDINGDKKPNEYAYDRFMFNICPAESNFKFNSKEKVTVYVGRNASEVTTQEKALSICKSNPQKCGRLLQLNNWEIPDDYPYNIR